MLKIIMAVVFACEIGYATYNQVPLEPLTGAVATVIFAGLALQWIGELLE